MLGLYSNEPGATVGGDGGFSHFHRSKVCITGICMRGNGNCPCGTIEGLADDTLPDPRQAA